MKYVERHALADPDAAARRIVEIADASAEDDFGPPESTVSHERFMRPHGNSSGFFATEKLSRAIVVHLLTL